ncbi:hypothetical protein ABJY78_05445 [Vibrio parahaemolyticus]|uniref:hypothetical protein n=1 Tax=Vibrio parahaemolyticus TaxID=670 RepID=UPI0032AE88BD
MRIFFNALILFALWTLTYAKSLIKSKYGKKPIINYQKGIIIMRKSVSKATRNAALSITLSISAIAIAATCFYSVKTISEGKIEERAAMEQLVAKRKATMNKMDEFVIKKNNNTDSLSNK